MKIFCFRYAQYGDISPKVDVYAFGVVLYELISAKEAVVKTNEIVTESKGLVALVVILFSDYRSIFLKLLCLPINVRCLLLMYNSLRMSWVRVTQPTIWVNSLILGLEKTTQLTLFKRWSLIWYDVIHRI